MAVHPGLLRRPARRTDRRIDLFPLATHPLRFLTYRGPRGPNDPLPNLSRFSLTFPSVTKSSPFAAA
jgi:hypothetical protein